MLTWTKSQAGGKVQSFLSLQRISDPFHKTCAANCFEDGFSKQKHLKIIKNIYIYIYVKQSTVKVQQSHTVRSSENTHW